MLLCKPYFLRNLNRYKLIICLQLSFSHWFSFVGLMQLKLLRIVTLVLSKISFLVLQQKFAKKSDQQPLPPNTVSYRGNSKQGSLEAANCLSVIWYTSSSHVFAIDLAD